MSITPLAADFWATPELRGSLLLIAATLCWTLDVLPDYVVALGVIVVLERSGDRPQCSQPLRICLTGVEMLGYPARSPAAVGIGLAAFTGSGLLSRIFL